MLERKAVIRKAVIRCGLEALHFSRLPALVKPLAGGIGAIATLHRVTPAGSGRFRPNRFLEITPEFLERLVRRLQRTGVDLVSLDEMHDRLAARNFRRRFLALTFDDGYRDNKQWAYPILKAANVPFAIYVATSFADRLGELYWVALESIVAANDVVAIRIGGSERSFPCRTLGEKNETFRTIGGTIASCSSETEAHDMIEDLERRYAVDLKAICNDLCLTWDEIAELAADPLVTIGSHTVHHYVLPRNPESVVRTELCAARAALEAALGREVRHLAYPYGAAGTREFAIAGDLGFKTAVTTRPAVLFPQDGEALMRLPRISVDGDLASERYVDVLLSGTGTALWNGVSRAARAVRGRRAPRGGR